MKQQHGIIVGYGPGVGHGIAKAFGAAGFHLSLIARSKPPEQPPGEFSSAYFQADAGDAPALNEAIAQASKQFGPPDVLIYNAFKFSSGKPSTMEPQQLTDEFNVNVSGALSASRAVLPTMLKRKAGTVLFTGGGWAIYPTVDYASASIGKAGLRSLAFLLAEELQGAGVRFGTVTIMGTVQTGTTFDPGVIGKSFLDLYQSATDTFPVELQFKGL